MVDRREVLRALSLVRARDAEWPETIVWARDAPELGLGGVERVLLVSAWMHAPLMYYAHDMRRVEVLAWEPGRVLVRAPEENPYVTERGALAAPFAEPAWATFASPRDGSQDAPFVGDPDPASWLAGLVAAGGASPGRAAEAGQAWVDTLARDLGDPRSWVVSSELTLPALEEAYCCGYSARIFEGAGVAVLFAAGQYCG